MGSESVGEIFRPERKTLGDRFQNLCDSLVTSREVTHATTSPRFGKWLVRAIQSLNRGMHPSAGFLIFGVWAVLGEGCSSIP